MVDKTKMAQLRDQLQDAIEFLAMDWEAEGVVGGHPFWFGPDGAGEPTFYVYEDEDKDGDNTIARFGVELHVFPIPEPYYKTAEGE